MSEEKQVKNKLIKHMFLNLIAFGIIFTIVGFSIYSQFKTSLYMSADEELIRSINMREMKNNNVQMREQRQGEIREIYNPRLIKIIRNANDNTIISEDNNMDNNNELNEVFANINFNKNLFDKIYEIQVEGYYYRAINHKNADETYSQILINVDAEKDIAANFIKNIIISFSIATVTMLFASYILAKRTLKPIVDSWRRQTRFVQDASHELRTPLTIIKAKQESLLEKPETKIIDNVEDISISLNETQRLTKLIKELMELAKNDSHTLVLNKEQFDLDEELISIINLYKDVAKTENKNLTIELNYKEKILADSNKLKELLIILLDNSIKYTQENDTIEVKTYKQDNKCVIEVIDSGIGISKDAIDHVFERFYREETSRTREKGGMGLGLSIAYNIVELHKGTIKFDKNMKKGTRVIVKLPK